MSFAYVFERLKKAAKAEFFNGSGDFDSISDFIQEWEGEVLGFIIDRPEYEDFYHKSPEGQVAALTRMEYDYV